MKDSRFGSYDIADFPREEYNQRLERAQKLMRDREIDVMLVVTENHPEVLSSSLNKELRIV